MTNPNSMLRVMWAIFVQITNPEYYHKFPPQPHTYYFIKKKAKLGDELCLPFSAHENVFTTTFSSKSLLCKIFSSSELRIENV